MTTSALPTDSKGRAMYPIPRLPGCYESAKARRARIARNAAKAAK